jgi:DNA-binding response OmpR family regulator
MHQARVNGMAKILVVEDDKGLLNVLVETLGLQQYQVETATDGNDGYNLIQADLFDLAILDWNLPSLTGIEICKRYRAKGGKTPIIILTGKKETDDKVTGLDAGADDYLTKPFAPPELNARVKALLRRAHGTVEDSLVAGAIILEPTKFKISVSGHEIRLMPKEFAILELLMRYPGRVFSADEIVSRLWDSSESPNGEVVRSHVKSLRKKLEPEDPIETIYGLGYKLKN